MPKIKKGGFIKHKFKLQFTEDERADPPLEKTIKKADKAADKYEKAQVKLPKKMVKIKERTFDEVKLWQKYDSLKPLRKQYQKSETRVFQQAQQTT